MLTALREDGSLFYLVPRFPKKQLEKVRSESFYCPECKEKVILKMGLQRMEHFAHLKGSLCVESYERESHYHLSGKIKIFNWLKSKGANPILEPYLKPARQRPDISFRFQGKPYVLEYQCSTIPTEIMLKRTKVYQKINCTPIWVLGGKNIKRKGERKVALTNFEYLFATKSPSGSWYLPCFCSSSNLFILITRIFPISTKNALAHFHILKLNSNLPIQTLMDVHKTQLNKSESWNRELRLQKSNFLLRGNHQNDYLRELYMHSLNILLLPPFIGLPVPNGIVIETPPLIWQTYLFIDQLQHKKEGELISYTDFFRSFCKRIDKNQVKIRIFPLVPNVRFTLPLYEYLQLLVHSQVLEQVNSSTYRIKQQIIVRTNPIQQQEFEDHYYKAYFQSF